VSDTDTILYFYDTHEIFFVVFTLSDYTLLDRRYKIAPHKLAEFALLLLRALMHEAVFISSQ
jgi:hypothetical protein